MVGSTTSLPSKHLLLEPQLAATPSLTYTRALLQKSHTQMLKGKYEDLTRPPNEVLSQLQFCRAKMSEEFYD
jgi:hypothetical protein